MTLTDQMSKVDTLSFTGTANLRRTSTYNLVNQRSLLQSGFLRRSFCLLPSVFAAAFVRCWIRFQQSRFWQGPAAFGNSNHIDNGKLSDPS